MTRPTKYDDDGVRAKAEEKKGRGMSIHTEAALVLAFAMTLTTCLFGYMLARQGELIDTLEHRIDYDRTREVEWFHRLNTQLFELGVEAVETRQTLARAIKAHHPGGTTAKAYMTDTEFYGKVTFYGPVEFIPEEE